MGLEAKGMGSGSSSHTTVETYDRSVSDTEDPDAVATPLRPAYAPTPSSAPPTALSPRPFGTHNATPFNPAFDDDPEEIPTPPATAPPALLPFQPPHPAPYAHPFTQSHAHMSYYPLEMGSGLVLSRVVRVLEATPPPYLLLPEHPHATPTIPLHAPPAPPNTANGRRCNATFPTHYPGMGKTRNSEPSLGGAGGMGVFNRVGGLPPPSP